MSENPKPDHLEEVDLLRLQNASLKVALATQAAEHVGKMIDQKYGLVEGDSIDASTGHIVRRVG